MSTKDVCDFLARMQAQQEEFQKMQLKMQTDMYTLMADKLNSSPSQQTAPSPSPLNSNHELTLDTLSNSIAEFIYDAENDLTFEAWYKRYEGIFAVDMGNVDENTRVRILLRKLNTSAHEKYVNYILPQNPSDVPFSDTVKTLKEIFGPQLSLFNIRYNCLKLAKDLRHDIVTYAGIVNRECERFKLSSLTADQFKCLIFVAGLQSSTDSESRLRLLNKLESDDNATVKMLVEEYKRLASLKRDAKMVENPSHLSSIAVVNSIKERRNKPKPERSTWNRKAASTNSCSSSKTKPRTPCWLCGGMHFVRECPFTQHRCKECGSLGHKEGYCGTHKAVSNHPGPHSGRRPTPDQMASASTSYLQQRETHEGCSQQSLSTDTVSICKSTLIQT